MAASGTTVSSAGGGRGAGAAGGGGAGAGDGGGGARVGGVLRGGPGSDRLLPGYDSRAADDITPDSLLWDDAGHSVHLDLAHGRASGFGDARFVTTHVSVLGSRYGDRIDGSDHRDMIYAGKGSDIVRAAGGDD